MISIREVNTNIGYDVRFTCSQVYALELWAKVEAKPVSSSGMHRVTLSSPYAEYLNIFRHVI